MGSCVRNVTRSTFPDARQGRDDTTSHLEGRSASGSSSIAARRSLNNSRAVSADVLDATKSLQVAGPRPVSPPRQSA
eukprot:scaffold170820_cov31-Tisochrysis_lutea.AAC.2